MKECPKCKGEMQLMNNTKGIFIKRVEKISDNPYELTHEHSYYAQLYICSKCGFVEQYVPIEFLNQIF